MGEVGRAREGFEGFGGGRRTSLPVGRLLKRTMMASESQKPHPRTRISLKVF